MISALVMVAIGNAAVLNFIIIVAASAISTRAEFFAGYGLNEAVRISDPDCELYGKFGLARAPARQCWNPSPVKRAFEALARGHFPGRVVGDVLQKPGVFLVHKGEIIRAFRPELVGARAPLQSLYVCPDTHGLHHISSAQMDETISTLKKEGWHIYVLPEGINGTTSFFRAVKATLPLAPPLWGDDNWPALKDSLVWGLLGAHQSSRVAIFWPGSEVMDKSLAPKVLANVVEYLADPEPTEEPTAELAVFMA